MPRVKSEAAIEDVADTALWIAAYRARETARADALFRDPLAARLAGPKGARVAATMTSAEQFYWMTAIRTVVIDELLLEAVARGAGMVLNLGAGLDTPRADVKRPPRDAGVGGTDAPLAMELLHRAPRSVHVRRTAGGSSRDRARRAGGASSSARMPPWFSGR